MASATTSSHFSNDVAYWHSCQQQIREFRMTAQTPPPHCTIQPPTQRVVQTTSRTLQDETFQSLATAVEQMRVAHKKDERELVQAAPTLPSPLSVPLPSVAAPSIPADPPPETVAMSASATFEPVPYIVPIITRHFQRPAPVPISTPTQHAAEPEAAAETDVATAASVAPSASYFGPTISALTSRSLSSALTTISSPLSALFHQMTTTANDKRNATTIARDNVGGGGGGIGIGIAADNDYFNVKMAMVTVDCIDDADAHLITTDITGGGGGGDEDAHHAGWIVMRAPTDGHDDDDDNDDGEQVEDDDADESRSDEFELVDE